MDTVLRQSKAMCPFLKKSSPATLRALSTAVRPKQASSPCGGTMSKLQVLANRCPIMSKAIAVQSAQYGRRAMMPRAAGLRAFGAHHKASKAGIHTSSEKVRPVERPMFNGGKGEGYSISAKKKEATSLTLVQSRLPSAAPPTLRPARLPALRIARSTTTGSILVSWTRSTRTSRTATSTTSTAWPRSSPAPTWPTRRSASRCGAPTIIWAWAATATS